MLVGFFYQLRRMKEKFNEKVEAIKAEKDNLILECAGYHKELTRLQARLDEANVKSLPSVPYVEPMELQRDPFKVCFNSLFLEAL